MKDKESSYILIIIGAYAGSILAFLLLIWLVILGVIKGKHALQRFSASQALITFETTELSDVKMKEIEGKKLLAKADWDRKIQIADAKAKAEAAKALAQVEIERAKGIAEANRIVGDSLKGNDAYLRYLWIDKLHEGNQTIYIPTEAGLPILEAGKRGSE